MKTQIQCCSLHKRTPKYDPAVRQIRKRTAYVKKGGSATEVKF